MRQVPLQVLSERSAEAQAAGQSNAEQLYVTISVAADLKQAYSALQVRSCVFLAVMEFCATFLAEMASCVIAIPGFDVGLCLSCLTHWQDLQCFTVPL